MDCVGVVQSVEGLRKRRLKGLKRPTKIDPVLGTIELVREERCHGWQIQREFLPTRRTIVDQILDDSQDIPEAVAFITKFTALERVIREKIVRARYFEFFDEDQRLMPFQTIHDNLDDWMVLFRVNRWGKGKCELLYDCTDAPEQTLLRSPQIWADLDENWTIYSVHFHSESVAMERRVGAYRQRVIPEGCGFVQDCVADQFVLNEYVRLTPELVSLFDQSIEQTAALHEAATPTNKQFLLSALDLLREKRKGNG